VSFDPSSVERWASSEPQAAAVLQSLLFDEDDLVRWRAVEAIGRVAAVRAVRDLEPVRELIRRTLWLMNDESGGLLWHGPQLIAAVLANVTPLCEEFVGILESFLEEEPFRAGTRWALWRLAAVRPSAVAAAAPGLAASFTDADPAVRGHAALALSAACGPSATAALARDPAPLVVFDYRTGTLRPTTVGELASGRF
jgi:HEAT repeat protein